MDVLRVPLLMAMITAAWAAITVVAMTYGTTYDWPDYVHVSYGFPVAFATHTLSTIGGPADKWVLSIGQLAEDLACWTLTMVVLVLAMACLGRKSRPQA